ncbi:MAG: hypothetical protein OXI76_10190 [Gemmatimonadota bacterium]|nr:hypothetical protein [Gemmatimonadota bacterium]
MKAWTETLALAALAVLFTLTLAGCEDAAPGVAATPDPAPGDPAIYAPDGWPLQMGERVSYAEMGRVSSLFRLPERPRTRWSYWGGSLNLVGDRVYAARFDYDPTKVGDYDFVYRGHFRIRFEEWKREYEPELPPEFHGKVEYYYQPISRPPPVTSVYDSSKPTHDTDGRRLRLDPDWVPYPTNLRVWPDYPERRK